MAANSANLPVVKELIRRGAKPNNLLNKPMSHSVTNYLKNLVRQNYIKHMVKYETGTMKRPKFPNALVKSLRRK
jgi:hypothetical protein